MSYSSNNLRKACLAFEQESCDKNRIDNYFNFSRELRDLSIKYHILQSNSSNLNIPKINNSHDEIISNNKRHQKCILAKMELKRLIEKSKTGDEKGMIMKNEHKNIQNESSYKNLSKICDKFENLKIKNKPFKIKKSVKFCPDILFWDSALEGDLESLKKYIKEVSNIDSCNFSGVNALHNAINSGSFECVQFLVEQGCNVNQGDQNGWTSLHYAAFYGKSELCDYLIQNGANVYLQTFNNDQLTPYDLCKKFSSNNKCLDILLGYEKTVGLVNNGIVYGSHSFHRKNIDELSFNKNEELKIINRGDKYETFWWWARNKNGKEGYVPFSLLSVYYYNNI